MTTPTGTPFQKPSPDWDMVTVAWAGTYLDGSAATGKLELKYDGTAPMLDDDPDLPLSIFGKSVSVPISETTVMIGGQSRTVGYVAVQIPASNDPDITGGGGTYTFTEKLAAGGGRSNVTFVADKDIAGGVIWLNKVAGMEPSPGEPLPVWSYAEFTSLVERVGTLEAGGVGGGGVALTSYWDQVATLPDYPDTFPVDLTDTATATQGALADTAVQPADITDFITAADVPAAPTWGTLTGKPAVIAAGTSQTAARDAIGAGTSNLALGTGATTAKAGDYQPTWDQVTNKPTTFAPATHNHDALYRPIAYTPSVADVPSLPASKVTSGTFDTARIPSLAITKVTGLVDELAGKVTAVTGATLMYKLQESSTPTSANLPDGALYMKVPNGTPGAL